MLRRVGFVGVLLVVVLATVPAGAPVQLSYVYSDSMEPTIGVNDGYVLVPAGDVQPGDIVTFWSPERNSYVTHRVVGETRGGFLTKGDNNAMTDQATHYPPVTREQIRGSVLSVGETPLLIPELGLVISVARANLMGLLALVGGGLAVVWYRDGVSRPARSVPRIRDVARPVFLVGFVAAVGFLAYGGASHDLSLVAVDSAGAATGPQTMLVGTSETVEAQVTLPERPFTARVVGAQGLDVTSVTRTAPNVTVAGEVHPPRSIGPVPARITMNRYPSVLPLSVLERLHATHPLAAASAVSTVIFAPLWLAYRVAIDDAAPLRRARARLWTILLEGFE